MSRKIGFIGGDSQVGTTMTAQAVAEVLAAEGARVLFVLASGKTGNDYISNRDNRSIDDIKANLINGHIDGYELGQVLTKEKELWVLPGIRDVISASYYTERVTEPLCRAAEDFDFVIFDCGDDLKQGLTISGVNICDERYVVLTQQEKTLRRFAYMKEYILDPLNLKGKLLINKHKANVSLLTGGEIGRMFSMEVCGKIPYIEYGWQAEIERNTLLKDAKYSRAIYNIADVITGKTRESKSWLKNLILKST